MEVINFQLDVIKRFRQIYARQTAFGCGKCLTLCRIQRSITKCKENTINNTQHAC